jgi:hypothetical protein
MAEIPASNWGRRVIHSHIWYPPEHVAARGWTCSPLPTVLLRVRPGDCRPGARVRHRSARSLRCRTRGAPPQPRSAYQRERDHADGDLAHQCLGRGGSRVRTVDSLRSQKRVNGGPSMFTVIEGGRRVSMARGNPAMMTKLWPVTDRCAGGDATGRGQLHEPDAAVHLVIMVGVEPTCW